MTGEMWKNISPFWHCKHYARRGYESGAALAEDMGMPVSKMWESIEAQIQASLNTAQDHDGGPYPVYPSGKSRDENSREMGSGKKFFHNAISGAGFAAQPTLSQLSFQRSIAAWVDWKLMRTTLSSDLFQRRSAV